MCNLFIMQLYHKYERKQQRIKKAHKAPYINILTKSPMDNGHMGGVVVPPCFSPQIFKQKRQTKKAISKNR